MSVMGLDIGTTGAKAVIYCEEGKLLGAGYAEYSLHHPQPGWSELDPEEVWQGTSSAIRQALQQAGSKDPVRAIAAASQGEACVPVDTHGKPLARAMVSFDARSELHARFLAKKIGERDLFRMTGMPPHGMYTICKILWWKENMPELYKRVRRFLPFGEYILHRLGASDPCIDQSMAARTMALDLKTGDWSSRVLDAAGVGVELLPPVALSGTGIDLIGKEIAVELGLPEGVLLVTGGHDQPCGALAAGIGEPGAALDATGTVECLTAVLPSPRLNLEMLKGRYPSYPHVADHLWVTIAFNFTGGVLLRWFRDTFGEPEVSRAAAGGRDPYELLIEGAAEDAGQVFVLPHFTCTGNPWFDTESAGALVGLKLSTGRAEIVKAVLDGITYEIRLNLDRLKRADVEVKRLRAVGGGARSRRWLQLKADIFNLPVSTLNIPEGAAFGAALLAGAASGIFTSASAAAEEFVQEVECYEPQPEAARRHEERFAAYRALYPALKPFYQKLNG